MLTPSLKNTGQRKDMKIVVDTNVVISGVFFNGLPHKLLNEIVLREVEIVASKEILDEYYEIAEDLVNSHTGSFNKKLFDIIVDKMDIVNPKTKIDICRDPDDNKFLECAVDENAIYRVSGDQDLVNLLGN